MTAAQFIFYFFAGLTVVSGLFILFTKNVLHAVLSLLSVFIGVSALYVFAGADFLAVTQLVIYVGGVLVLMLFGVMLTNRETGAIYPISKHKYFISGIISGSSILGILVYLFVKNQNVFLSASEKSTSVSAATTTGTIRILGISLISEYILVFEAIGVLLLIALIGAAFIAGRKAS
jgi:NADH:ubiquinone oxidoreductase subunit 6 (subunit J)